MFNYDPDKISFRGVGIFLIVIGASVFAYGTVAWLFNYFADTAFVLPSEKFIGGLAVLGLGYIILEIELLRKK